MACVWWRGGSAGARTLAAAVGELAVSARMAGARPQLAVAVGPEGGLAAAEVAAAQAHGWAPVSLGLRILRAETAAVSVAAVVAALLEPGEQAP
jgi:16S rRNA (uracil1498-N3)-methyltransferase